MGKRFINQKGFTLAEVLITLSIIGVVAALTIPTVVQNYQKTQTVTQLKKVYSALSNTTNLAIAEHGPIEGWEIAENTTGEDAVNFVNAYMTPYLKVSKNCENKTTDDCDFKRSYLNSDQLTSISSSAARFYLNDGTLIAVRLVNDASASSKQAYIVIDINGQKRPNKTGKDVFNFYYIIDSQIGSVIGKFIPDGFTVSRSSLVSDSEYNCNKNQNGNRCAALIMKDSWQIKDDYPWN
jgi:prepilin-type N-terminal cleavage/methylation domain-containing protein